MLLLFRDESRVQIIICWLLCQFQDCFVWCHSCYFYCVIFVCSMMSCLFDLIRSLEFELVGDSEICSMSEGMIQPVWRSGFASLFFCETNESGGKLFFLKICWCFFQLVVRIFIPKQRQTHTHRFIISTSIHLARWWDQAWLIREKINEKGDNIYKCTQTIRVNCPMILYGFHQLIAALTMFEPVCMYFCVCVVSCV